MLKEEVPGLTEFLIAYPLMALRPSAGKFLTLKGRFDFLASNATFGDITDSFFLTIYVPRTFPRDLPVVFEPEGRIPKDPDFHVNSTNGSFCLGSPLRIILTISRQPNLMGFVRELLVPFLFAVSYKMKNGGPFVFDELAHGSRGLLNDYSDLFKLDSTKVCSALKLVGMKKRLANKSICPCECGRKVGRCKFNRKIALLRPLASRTWYRNQLEYVLRLIAIESQRKNR